MNYIFICIMILVKVFLSQRNGLGEDPFTYAHAYSWHLRNNFFWNCLKTFFSLNLQADSFIFVTLYWRFLLFPFIRALISKCWPLMARCFWVVSKLRKKERLMYPSLKVRSDMGIPGDEFKTEVTRWKQKWSGMDPNVMTQTWLRLLTTQTPNFILVYMLLC